MALRPALINVMAKAAEKAGRALVRDFGEVEHLQVSRKGPADFVSTADIKAEKTIRYELEKARPNAGFLMEESGETAPAEGSDRWIVDPLDGTTNFLHGLPQFATSIAFEEAGEVIAAAVYNPVTDELFWAFKGKGAYLNDSRLRVSARESMDISLIATGIPFKGHGDVERFTKQAAAVTSVTSGLRRFGAASLDLAYVAAGKFDGFWEMGLQPWDVAAGVLLVREAGGFVEDPWSGNDPVMTGNLVASNGGITKKLTALLKPL